jgi:hypothetical protein
MDSTIRERVHELYWQHDVNSAILKSKYNKKCKCNINREIDI